VQRTPKRFAHLKGNSGARPPLKTAISSEGRIHVYKQARLDSRVTLIPGDSVTDNLVDLLRSNDFDFDAATSSGRAT